MEDFLAKFYLAIVFGVLLVSALFLGYQIKLTQQLENNLDKFRTKKTSEKDSYQNLFKLGQLYLRKKIYNKAIEEFRSSFKKWDKNDKLGIASLFNTLGFTYYQLKEYEIAAYYYKIALTVTPDYVTSLSNLAYLYQSQNQIDNLQPIYKQLAVLDPNSEKTAEINNYLSKRLKNSE
jgi:tetratricopeptide (TPR) repeat protein